MYFIAAYIRLYPARWFSNQLLIGGLMLCSIAFSCLSIISVGWLRNRYGMGNSLSFYWLLEDTNKLFALTTSISSFLFFNNLKIRSSKVINGIAASTFGVFLIHANSDAMRQWLWHDLLKVVDNYNNCIAHSIISVLSIFAVCTIIDLFRRSLIEKTCLGKITKTHAVQNVESIMAKLFKYSI